LSLVANRTKFELVINLKSAKQIGLTTPRTCWHPRTGWSDDCYYRDQRFTAAILPQPFNTIGFERKLVTPGAGENVW